MRVALIDTEEMVVTNVILMQSLEGRESLFHPSLAVRLEDGSRVSPGWRYMDGEFSEPDRVEDDGDLPPEETLDEGDTE